MKKALLNIRKPYPDVHYAIVEYPNMLTIRVFENNIMSFNVDQRVIILEYLELLRKTLQSFGVQCELEGISGDVILGRRGRV